MSIIVGNNLKLIIEAIRDQCSKKVLVDRFEFKELLETAEGIEKCVIARNFCKLDWNVGSIRVLAVLQELCILTAKEFILCLKDNKSTQLILNDFLEDEFDLLANLFISAFYDSNFGIRVNAILDECLLTLFTDLLQDPNLNNLNYLAALKSLLPTEILSKVTLKHVDTILELHKSNVQGAFINFTEWIDEGVDNVKFTKTLHKILICDMEQEVLKHLFKLSSREKFKMWKFYLILLQTIGSNCKPETSSFIRKYLKARVREIAAAPNKRLVLHMLLTARAATATTMDKEKNINAYADWYRQNIAEMKFVLNTEEFQMLCGVLEQCIAFEMEEYYLDIHATISISPPVLCGKIVQGYKSKCKLRLSQIKSKNPDAREMRDADESILIDSD